MKSYVVLSDAPVLGHTKGETFDADIPEAQERRMIERGSIRLAGDVVEQPQEPATTEGEQSGDKPAEPSDKGKGGLFKGGSTKEGGN